MKPVDIRPVGENEILISWQDGHRSLYAYEFLRYQCPCAQCVDERTGKRIIQRGQISKGVNSREILPVGNYALRIQWSDGHHTGIYSFDYLRSICPCGKCLSGSSLSS